MSYSGLLWSGASSERERPVFAGKIHKDAVIASAKTSDQQKCLPSSGPAAWDKGHLLAALPLSPNDFLPVVPNASRVHHSLEDAQIAERVHRKLKRHRMKQRSKQSA